MTFGHNTRYYTESVYDTTNALALPVIYTRYMTVSLAYVPDASNILEIGFGGGRTAWYLHSLLPSSMITSVELDPEVVALAKKHFAITPSGNFSVEVADGRKFLQSSGGCWNIILVDAYRGPFVPFHLLTREFFELVKSRLCTGGVAVQNVEPTTMMFDSALATIKTVFKNADAYNARGNIVVVAYDGELRSQSDLTARAETVQGKYKLVYPLTEMMPERRVVREIRDAKVLTDDFAPVESLLAIEQHNRKLGDFSEAPPK
jgi:spermidine synthase